MPFDNSQHIDSRKVEKPTSRLFEKISTEAYQEAFSRLQSVREEVMMDGRPMYRDDEILMWILSRDIMRRKSKVRR